MAQIFISYRREEGAPYARLVFDALSQHFGEASVFYDRKAIEPGLDFLEVIQQELQACSVLIALIGDDWLTYTATAGVRRIDQPEDIVHQEIATALQRNIRLIPVLLRGTSMPSSEQLPKELAKLANRNAIELTEAKWEYDQQRLIEVLQKIVGGATPKPEPVKPDVENTGATARQPPTLGHASLIGRWHVDIGGMVPSTMLLELFPNGVCQGSQQVPWMGTVVFEGAAWMFDPYNRLLQIQGAINFAPFNLAILIQRVEGTGYAGVDNQNIAYHFKRV